MSKIINAPYFFTSIIGTFFFLSIPLMLLPLFDFSYYYLASFYTTLIVFPHFSSTFYIYFQKKYLKYFIGSPLRIFIYFVVPLSVFVLFISIAKMENYREYGLWIIVLIRLSDYFHTNKQTFGVQRLIAGRGFKYDIYLYYGVILFLCFNYLSRRNILQLQHSEWIIILVLIPILGLYINEILKSSISNKKWSLTYIFLQLIALVPGVINPKYYFLGLAVHSVEYHLLIHKRFFYKDLFKFVLVGIVLIVMSFCINRVRYISDFEDSFFNLSYLYSSIVFLHYYLDTFIWRFSNPAFAQDLKRL